MAWQIVAEVLDHCPDLSYRQFRVLVVLASDAKLPTRQCAPGMADIARRGNCGVRTAKRALAGLREQKLIRLVKPPAPERNAVFEILPMPGTGDSMVAPVTGDSIVAPRRGPLSALTGDSMVAPSISIPSGYSYNSLSARASNPREALAGLGATEREIDLTIAGIYDNPRIDHPAAYLRRCIDSDGGAELLAEARRTDPRVILAWIGADEDQAEALLADMKAADVTDPARALREKLGEDGAVAGLLLDRARSLLGHPAAEDPPQEGPDHAST